MPLKLLTATMVTALAAGLPVTAAHARNAMPHATKVGQSITVEAPRERQTGMSYSGLPIETLTAKAVVNFGDLDLASQKGRATLHRRVLAAATSSCKWLDKVYPIRSQSTSDQQCIVQAVAGASKQVDTAIAAAA